MAEAAKVTSNLKVGSLVLAGPGGDVALDWKAGGEVEACALPPGEYSLRTVRLEREEDGVHWCVSATGKPGKALSLRAGATTDIPVDDKVRFAGRATRKGRQLQLNFTLTNKAHQGLTIYKAGKRVPMRYKIVSADGKELAAGVMNYG